jgi:hypothetical protein
LPSLLERLRQETSTIIIDFHAGATAEKRAFFPSCGVSSKCTYRLKYAHFSLPGLTKKILADF